MTAPTEFLVLMGAMRDPAELVAVNNGSHYTYKFEQKIPIPAYLIAIAVGKLSSKRIGPRSHIFAEPGILEAAAYEFGQTEEYLKTAEKFAGP